MKLSEFATDRAVDVLCEISVYITHVVTDNELMDELKKKLELTGEESRIEIMTVAMEKISKLVPLVLKKHKSDIFGILAAIHDVTVDDVSKQSIVKTMEQIRDVVKDKELVDFFKSCVSEEKE